MLSQTQKTVISNTKIRPRKRYVRLPLQRSNRVRALKTDVNLNQTEAHFNNALNDLRRFSYGSPIVHIQFDFTTTRHWSDPYERICDAYRSHNGSRILRRMHITGFRLFNVERRVNCYKIYTDHYIANFENRPVFTS